MKKMRSSLPPPKSKNALKCAKNEFLAFFGKKCGNARRSRPEYARMCAEHVSKNGNDVINGTIMFSLCLGCTKSYCVISCAFLYVRILLPNVLGALFGILGSPEKLHFVGKFGSW